MPRNATILPFPSIDLREVFGRQLAERGVVAGYVGVLRAGIGETAIHDRHVHAFLLHLRNGLRQGGRLERERSRAR